MSGKGFFAVDLNVIEEIFRTDDYEAEELLAYLILASHTAGNKKDPYKLSTAGAKAISSKAGISYRRAQTALNHLVDRQLTVAQQEANDELPRKRKPRYMLRISDTPEWVYLAHSLVEGIGQGRRNRPLSRLFNQTQMHPGITAKQARLDTIWLLINLHQEQSIMDYGGITPHVLYKKWCSTGEELQLSDYLQITRIETDGSIFSTQEFVARCYSVDGYTKAASNRFWHAFNQLNRLGFLYEVLAVWDGNPREIRHPETLYTLYVFDSHARKSDPFIAHKINRAMLEVTCADADKRDEYDAISGSGRFWYASDGYPLSTYRLRFRPATEDTGMGFENEERKADYWSKMVLNSVNIAV